MTGPSKCTHTTPQGKIYHRQLLSYKALQLAAMMYDLPIFNSFVRLIFYWYLYRVGASIHAESLSILPFPFLAII